VRKEDRDQKPLKLGDFPVNIDGTAVIAQDGRPIAATSSPALADDIADRLNSHEARREDDK
jgi:hypothetical protein